MKTLVPPPTEAELAIAGDLARRENRDRFGSCGVDDHWPTREQVLGIVDDLRHGRRFVFVRDESDARALRRFFPRVPCIVRPSESQPRLAPPEVRRQGTPAPCARCELEEKLAELVDGPEAPMRVAPSFYEDDVADLEARLAEAPQHPCAGACRLRWLCQRCEMVYAVPELEQAGWVCVSQQCRGPQPSFAGIVIGELN